MQIRATHSTHPRIDDIWGDALRPTAGSRGRPASTSSAWRRSRHGRALGGFGLRALLATAARWTSRVKDGRIVGVRGRAEDRVNRGRLGPEGPATAGRPTIARTG